jgi:cardiolipin synthase
MITWSEAYYFSEWIIRLSMLFYVPNNRTPAAARTWLLLIFLLPWPGLLLYMLIGRIYLPKRRIRLQAMASQKIRATRFQLPGQDKFDCTDAVRKTAELAKRLGDFNPVGGNRFELLTDYAESPDVLLSEIASARKHVHLLYYIWADDEVGRKFADACIAAAGRGVACRVLMDAVGSAHALRGLAVRMRAAGVEVTATLPVNLFRRSGARIDLRNHRKIAVIDGWTGYTGSQNIASPGFIPDCPNEEMVVRCTGPIVQQLQSVFLADREVELGEHLDAPDLFPEAPPAGPATAQLLPAGPGYGRENVQEMMVDLLHGARKRVVVTTPYFVPDEPFLQAMRTAVLRGCEVHLVLPARSNQLVTNLAQESYYDQLLSAGVTIHLYGSHFLHAKHLSIDNEVALVGSSNIDIRSFALNAEVVLLIYDSEIVYRLREVQERYFAGSRVLTAKEWASRSWVSKTGQNIARLADSLL